MIRSSDGKEHELTPELLTIERKTFKQSSKCRLHVYPGATKLSTSSQSANIPRMLLSPHSALAVFFTHYWNTATGAESKIRSAA